MVYVDNGKVLGLQVGIGSERDGIDPGSGRGIPTAQHPWSLEGVTGK
ncbi:MAG: hypothetical protein ISR42_07065 [Acidimicrobiia bacterium]|nr:hypothetical protein [Actinomycetota bacterium]MBL6925129.1 hypothetical protein [Acidimicrobiia bacterium]